MPDFLLPFKHYVAEEIEGVLCHLLDGGNPSKSFSEADVRTQRRWWSEFSSKMQQWAGLLESKAYELFNSPHDERAYSVGDTYEDVVNGGFWCITGGAARRMVNAIEGREAKPTEFQNDIAVLQGGREEHNEPPF